MFVAAWLLLLIPTLVIGWLALGSVRQEGARIAQAERDAARIRAESIATTLDLGVAEARQGLLDTLSDLSRAGRQAERLEDWRVGNPLVRNVFVWHPDRGLLHPEATWPRGLEDRAFAARYEALFEGRIGWDPSPAEGLSNAGSLPAPGASSLSGRRQLRQLALQEVQGIEATPAMLSPVPEMPSGWIPWYAENRVHFLGWVEQLESGIRYGLEVEMMVLLSRLLPDFPAPVEAGESYALLDGSGRVFHQTGGGAEDPEARVAVPVGQELPHWQVSVSWARNSAAAGSGFAMLSTLVVGSFVAAILLGGSLLLWQARLQFRDAHQKTTFVANVSHELKTPLTTIRMYAELLSEGRIRDEAKKKSYLEVIVAETQRLTRLVGNVLEFGRLEQGRKGYKRSELDPVEVLCGVLDTLGPRFKEAGIQVQKELPEASVHVHSDRDAVEQILLNILDNCLKYASQGHEIKIEIDRAENCVEIHISDRGPGIPAAHRQRIFDKFHRVDDSLTAAQPGSGLGLSIARQMARDLGGDLTCQERHGGGSRFVLTLPFTEGGLS